MTGWVRLESTSCTNGFTLDSTIPNISSFLKHLVSAWELLKHSSEALHIGPCSWGLECQIRRQCNLISSNKASAFLVWLPPTLFVREANGEKVDHLSVRTSSPSHRLHLLDCNRNYSTQPLTPKVTLTNQGSLTSCENPLLGHTSARLSLPQGVQKVKACLLESLFTIPDSQVVTSHLCTNTSSHFKQYN